MQESKTLLVQKQVHNMGVLLYPDILMEKQMTAVARDAFQQL